MKSARRTNWQVTTAAGYVLALAAAAENAQGQSAVQAQEQSAAQSAPQSAFLEEVTVTATRRTENVNRVPISVGVVSQKTFDEQGFRTSEDLQKAVPSLAVIGGNTISRGTDSSNVSLANYTIRGIISPGGTTTTGVYLDDVPLQKRNAVSNAQSNGTPTPMLFDLERVEVLRGPQGTLYGGSSEGGAVRFLTRQPSLTEASGSARAEASNIDHGANTYELNGAVGAPIIQDVLGFRVSAFGRQNGGWIDMRDPFYVSGDPVRFKDANSSNVFAARAALVYKPTDELMVTLMQYHHRFQDDGGTQASSYIQTRDGSPTFSTPVRCYHGTTAAVPCTTPGAFVRTSDTYGPYQLGPYDSLDYFLMPSATSLDVSSLTVDYKLGPVGLKSITSYERDRTRSLLRLQVFPPAIQGGISLFKPYPDSAISWKSGNQHSKVAEELRASYASSLMDIVGGVYVAHDVVDTTSRYAFGVNGTKAEADQYALLQYGIPDANTLFALPLEPDNSIFNRVEFLDDKERAVFVDGTWHVTDRLNLLAGVRYSALELDYHIDLYGPTQGQLVPSPAGGTIAGVTKDKATTPRIGAQFQWTPTAMTYATAAEGFRGGGVNPGFSLAVTCFTLANLGLTPSSLPRTYKSDSTWSYEVGSKMRFFDRLQLNGSVFYIDWRDVQVSSAIGGCPPLLYNAGKARSQGFDLQADASLATGLTGTIGIGYVDGKYTKDALGPTPAAGFAPVVLIRKGDKLPVPAWQGTASLRYEFPLKGDLMGFLRGDYIFSSGYYSNPAGPGEAAYSPDSRFAEARHQLNIRIGLTRGAWDANLFASNLLESRDALSRGGGRIACPVSQGAACTTPAQYSPLFSVTYPQPRTVGLQFGYKFFDQDNGGK